MSEQEITDSVMPATDSWIPRRPALVVGKEYSLPGIGFVKLEAIEGSTAVCRTRFDSRIEVDAGDLVEKPKDRLQSTNESKGSYVAPAPVLPPPPPPRTYEPDLADNIARFIFDSCRDFGVCQRIQFMGGTYPDNEVSLSGLCEYSLAQTIRRALVKHLPLKPPAP